MSSAMTVYGCSYSINIKLHLWYIPVISSIYILYETLKYHLLFYHNCNSFKYLKDFKEAKVSHNCIYTIFEMRCTGEHYGENNGKIIIVLQW